jgi:hypothetical protein
LANGYRGFGQWSFGPIHSGRTPWRWEPLVEELLTLLQAVSTEQGVREDIAPRIRPHVTYFLQAGPTSLPPPNSAMILWIHQGINPFITLEPS